jgi:DNA-binding FrmR family transcriptional regulator
MIEDESSVREIIQQLSAIRSAMSQAANEELVCAIERTTEKKSPLEDKDRDEIRALLKLIR